MQATGSLDFVKLSSLAQGVTFKDVASVLDTECGLHCMEQDAAVVKLQGCQMQWVPFGTSAISLAVPEGGLHWADTVQAQDRSGKGGVRSGDQTVPVAVIG